jgi:hypothetical protein
MSRVGTGHTRRDLEIDLTRLDGGLNLATPPHNIKDNELHEALNFHYDKDSGRLATRPGLVKKTTAALPNPGVVMDAVTVQGIRYIIVATNYKLYYLSGTTYVEIGAFANTSGEAIPSFAQYKENLYVATAGQKLQRWNGVDWDSDITPHTCSIVIARGARLYTNDDADNDFVWVSQIQLDDQWGSSNNGFEFNAGWSDGDSILAMVPIGNDLALVKGPNNKSVMVLRGHPPDMFVAEVTRGTGAVGRNALSPIPNDLLMLDTDGMNTLAGVIQYGDLKVDPVGSPIGQALVREINSTAFIVHWPLQASTLMFPNNTSSLAYVLHYSISEDIPRWRWTRFLFGVGNIVSGIFDHASDTLYFLSHDGNLYTMSYSDIGTIYTDNGADFEQRLRTKVFDPPNHETLFKRAQFMYAPLALGTAGKFLYIYDDANTPIELATFTGDPFVVDEWDDILVEDAEAPPIGTPEPSKIVRVRRVQRRRNFQMGITVTAGAISISRMSVHASLVGRE